MQQDNMQLVRQHNLQHDKHQVSFSHNMLTQRITPTTKAIFNSTTIVVGDAPTFIAKPHQNTIGPI